jgi:hypothetical protein
VPALTFGGGVGAGDGLGDGDEEGDAEGVDDGDGASEGDVDGIAIGLAPHAATITAVRPRTSKPLALTPPSSTAPRGADSSIRPESGMTIGRLETALGPHSSARSQNAPQTPAFRYPENIASAIRNWTTPMSPCRASYQFGPVAGIRPAS